MSELTVYKKDHIITMQYAVTSDAYCLHRSIGINNMFGITHWHDFDKYMFAFYKNPNNTTQYTFIDIYYKFIQIYQNDNPIEIYRLYYNNEETSN